MVRLRRLKEMINAARSTFNSAFSEVSDMVRCDRTSRRKVVWRLVGDQIDEGYALVNQRHASVIAGSVTCIRLGQYEAYVSSTRSLVKG